MRDLSPTLLAAQKEASRRPYIKVVVEDGVGVVSRIDWQRLYTSSEADYHHALTLAGDGSLIRVRVEPPSSGLYYQRVTSPGPGSDFSSWTLLSTAVPGGVALSAQGAEVLLFFVPGSNPDSVFYYRSTDYGQNWVGPNTLASPMPGTDVVWLAAAHRPDGDLALFATVAHKVYVKTRTSGGWSGWSQWPNSANSHSGLATCYSGDWKLVVCGQDSWNSYKVWGCIYGDGAEQPAGTWSSLVDMTEASATASVQLRCPALIQPDVFRAFFVEKHTGQEAYQRPYWAHTLPGQGFSQGLWREPVPFDLTSDYGVAMAYQGSTVWLSTPFGVWQGQLSTATADLTDDVLGLLATASPSGGRVRMELDNSSGKYNAPGSGGLSALRLGSRLRVSPGYHTTAGPEAAPGYVYWIEGWDYHRQGGRNVLVIAGADGRGQTAAWHTRRQFAWQAAQQSVQELVAFLLARCGLPLQVLSSSSFFSTHQPAFALHPGGRGEDGIERLLDMVADLLFFREETACSKYPDLAEATAYSYGTDHVILSAVYSRTAPGINRVQAYGLDVTAESFSWGEVSEVLDRLRQVHDLNLTTAADARERADAGSSRAAREGYSGEVVVPPNCGQEMYDVVEITDPACGLSAARRRVMGLALLYEPGRGLYQHRLRLSGV
ncbi:MAG: hypothetical protein V3U31_00330 [Dehalococcoidia bacterium]